MSRINVCPACNAIKNGVKSRIALEHTCADGIFTVPNKYGGSATFNTPPTKEEIEAMNTMSDIAFTKLKKKKED